MIHLKEALIGKKTAKYADIDRLYPSKDGNYIVCAQTAVYKNIIEVTTNKDTIDEDLEFDFWILTELEIDEVFLVRYLKNEFERGDLRIWRMSDFPHNINDERLNSLLSNYNGGDKIGNISCLTMKAIEKIWD